MTNRVSVIIPSRLRENPNSSQGGLYLDLAPFQVHLTVVERP